MRLTLRTMLAYLDDVLEPSDAEQLGKKIQESDFANGLVHRIRAVTGKSRLGAPKLTGKGMGLDPNTVAEYLDSTLSPDRVPEFEKVCLESDVHLAEVAGCHQVLTRVLGEPAEVSPAARDRVYSMGSLQTANVAAQPTPPANTFDESGTREFHGDAKETHSKEPPRATATSTAAVSNDRVALPDLPDYLRANSRRRVLPYIATAVLVFLIASVAFLAIGPDSIVALFRPEQPAMPDGPNIEIPANPVMPESITGQTNTTADETDDTSSNDANETSSATTDIGTTETAATDTTNPKLPDAESGTSDPPEPAPIPGVTPPMPTDTPEASSSESTTPDTSTTPIVDPSGAGTPMPTKASDDVIVDVGRYISEKQIITRYDAKAEDWYRLPAGATLVSGDNLFVLPTFRPHMALASGVQLTVAGASMLQLQPPDSSGAPQLSVDYGRVVFFTIGKAGARVGLDLAGRKGVVTFVNADATLAVEVSRYRMPGTDPEKDLASTIVQLTTSRGKAQWEEDGNVTPIDEKNVLVIIDDQLGDTIPVENIAPWINSSDLSGIDEIALETLESLVDTKRPVVLSLQERVRDTRVEVRMLASRSLSYMDRHESFIEALNEKDNKSFWASSLDTAREALARSPKAAAAMREAFEKRRGADGAILYRLMWGYSPKQLREDGADAELVEFLGHESMDFRALCFLNLKQITGFTLNYRPEANERSRASSITKWQNKQRERMIVYDKSPSPPIPEGASYTPPKKSTATESPELRVLDMPEAKSPATDTP